MVGHRSVSRGEEDEQLRRSRFRQPGLARRSALFHSAGSAPPRDCRQRPSGPARQSPRRAPARPIRIWRGRRQGLGRACGASKGRDAPATAPRRRRHRAGLPAAAPCARRQRRQADIILPDMGVGAGIADLMFNAAGNRPHRRGSRFQKLRCGSPFAMRQA